MKRSSDPPPSPTPYTPTPPTGGGNGTLDEENHHVRGVVVTAMSDGGGGGGGGFARFATTTGVPTTNHPNHHPNERKASCCDPASALVSNPSSANATAAAANASTASACASYSSLSSSSRRVDHPDSVAASSSSSLWRQLPPLLQSLAAVHPPVVGVVVSANEEDPKNNAADHRRDRTVTTAADDPQNHEQSHDTYEYFAGCVSVKDALRSKSPLPAPHVRAALRVVHDDDDDPGRDNDPLKQDWEFYTASVVAYLQQLLSLYNNTRGCRRRCRRRCSEEEKEKEEEDASSCGDDDDDGSYSTKWMLTQLVLVVHYLQLLLEVQQQQQQQAQPQQNQLGQPPPPPAQQVVLDACIIRVLQSWTHMLRFLAQTTRQQQEEEKKKKKKGQEHLLHNDEDDYDYEEEDVYTSQARFCGGSPHRVDAGVVTVYSLASLLKLHTPYIQQSRASLVSPFWKSVEHLTHTLLLMNMNPLDPHYNHPHPHRRNPRVQMVPWPIVQHAMTALVEYIREGMSSLLMAHAHVSLHNKPQPQPQPHSSQDAFSSSSSSPQKVLLQMKILTFLVSRLAVFVPLLHLTTHTTSTSTHTNTNEDHHHPNHHHHHDHHNHPHSQEEQEDEVGRCGCWADCLGTLLQLYGMCEAWSCSGTPSSWSTPQQHEQQKEQQEPPPPLATALQKLKKKVATMIQKRMLHHNGSDSMANQKKNGNGGSELPPPAPRRPFRLFQAPAVAVWVTLLRHHPLSKRHCSLHPSSSSSSSSSLSISSSSSSLQQLLSVIGSVRFCLHLLQAPEVTKTMMMMMESPMSSPNNNNNNKNNERREKLAKEKEDDIDNEETVETVLCLLHALVMDAFPFWITFLFQYANHHHNNNNSIGSSSSSRPSSKNSSSCESSTSLVLFFGGTISSWNLLMETTQQFLTLASSLLVNIETKMMERRPPGAGAGNHGGLRRARLHRWLLSWLSPSPSPLAFPDSITPMSFSPNHHHHYHHPWSVELTLTLWTLMVRRLHALDTHKVLHDNNTSHYHGNHGQHDLLTTKEPTSVSSVRTPSNNVPPPSYEPFLSLAVKLIVHPRTDRTLRRTLCMFILRNINHTTTTHWTSSSSTTSSSHNASIQTPRTVILGLVKTEAITLYDGMFWNLRWLLEKKSCKRRSNNNQTKKRKRQQQGKSLPPPRLSGLDLEIVIDFLSAVRSLDKDSSAEWNTTHFSKESGQVYSRLTQKKGTNRRRRNEVALLQSIVALKIALHDSTTTTLAGVHECDCWFETFLTAWENMKSNLMSTHMFQPHQDHNRVVLILGKSLCDWIRRHCESLPPNTVLENSLTDRICRMVHRLVCDPPDYDCNGCNSIHAELMLALIQTLSSIGRVMSSQYPTEKLHSTLVPSFRTILSSSSSSSSQWIFRSFGLSSMIVFAQTVPSSHRSLLKPCIPEDCRSLFSYRVQQKLLQSEEDLSSVRNIIWQRLLEGSLSLSTASSLPLSSSSMCASSSTMMCSTSVFPKLPTASSLIVPGSYWMTMPTQEGRSAIVIFPPDPQSLIDIQYMMGLDHEIDHDDDNNHNGESSLSLSQRSTDSPPARKPTVMRVQRLAKMMDGKCQMFLETVERNHR